MRSCLLPPVLAILLIVGCGDDEVALPTTSDGVAFAPIPAIEGQDANQVLIIAAQGCPQIDARRADRLAAVLAERGIPVARVQEAQFRFTSQAELEGLDAIMRGQLPIVIVRGSAKNNPTVGEVVKEYQAGR